MASETVRKGGENFYGSLKKTVFKYGQAGMEMGSRCYTRQMGTEYCLMDLVRWSLVMTLLRANSVELWEESGR